MKKDVVLLKSDMGNLIATASGIWLCKNDESLNVSWEEIKAAQQSFAPDGAYCSCKKPSWVHDDGFRFYCSVCGKPPRR